MTGQHDRQVFYKARIPAVVERASRPFIHSIKTGGTPVLRITLALILAAVGCQSRPAVREVWSTKHLEAIGPVDHDYFLTDRASRIRSTSRLLPAAEQGEEFRVSWAGRDVELVQFEYRQMNAPDKVTAQDFRTNRRHSTTFWIRGDEFLKAGAVSAWRVTLWRDGELLAQKHSMLW